MSDYDRWGYARFWVLAAGFAATVGCGKASDPPGSSAAGANGTSEIQTADDFVRQFASNYCENIADCCDRQGFPTNDCESNLSDQLGAQLSPLTSNPKLRFNAAAAAACIDAYAAALSACTDHALFAGLEANCKPFEGTVALGGACAKDTECATPEGGVVACDGGVCGVASKGIDLSKAPRHALGETCTSTCFQTPREKTCSFGGNADPALGVCWLEDGLTCENGICIAAPKAGEACSSAGYCTRDAHCDSGTCVENLDSGPCLRDLQCLPSTVCDGSPPTCHALKANDDSCDVSDECLGGQCYEHRCRTWSVAQSASCLGSLDE